MKKRNLYVLELIIGIIIISIAGILINNLIINLIRTNMGLSYSWLMQPAGFAISEYLIPFKPSDNYSFALIVGWINSLRVIVFGLILSTFLGLFAGISMTSKNLILSNIAKLYIGLIRQVPLLIQLMFWYFVVFLGLSEKPHDFLWSLGNISNKGFQLLGIKLSVEYCALLIGLSVYSGASIAEVIRGGIKSVSQGQWEAFRSLGLTETIGLRRVIIPQALPAIVPGITSQYLNLAKNSTLAIAIGYADIYAISDTTITQTGRAIEGFSILLISFLLLNLVISKAMERVNTAVNHYKK